MDMWVFCGLGSWFMVVGGVAASPPKSLLLCRSFSIHATKQAIVLITKQRWALSPSQGSQVQRPPKTPPAKPVYRSHHQQGLFDCIISVPLHGSQSPALQISPSIQV